MAEKYCYNKFLMRFFGGEEKMKREDKGMVKLEFSQTTLFGHILKKISTFTFQYMVIPLGPHLVYT